MMKLKKIKNLQNKSILFFVFLAAFSIFAFSGCTKKTEQNAEPEPQIEEPAPVQEPEPAPVIEEKTPAPEPEPVPEPEPEPVAEPEPEPEPVVEKQPEDEYSRSVGDVAVSRDTFAEDKERILKIIESLGTIMRDFDYKSWLTYVDQESINYWSKPANLRKAQNRLPVKGLRLTSLQDYFKYVFVPARKGREITEIRYVSDTYVKAIEVGEDQDIVYYYFNKIDGHWMVNLPPLDD